MIQTRASTTHDLKPHIWWGSRFLVGVRIGARLALPWTLIVSTGPLSAQSARRLVLTEIRSVSVPDSILIEGAAISGGGALAIWGSNSGTYTLGHEGRWQRVDLPLDTRPLAASFGNGEVLRIVDGVSSNLFLVDASGPRRLQRQSLGRRTPPDIAAIDSDQVVWGLIDKPARVVKLYSSSRGGPARVVGNLPIALGADLEHPYVLAVSGGLLSSFSWVVDTIFDVYKADGTYMGVVVLPPSAWFVDASREAIWVIERGSVDEQYIVQYQMMLVHH